MERCAMKTKLIINTITILLLLTGCSSMQETHSSNNSIIKINREKSHDFIDPEDYFGMNENQSFYVSITMDRQYAFSGVGKYVTNDPNIKLQIKSLERDIIKNKQNPTMENNIFLNLNKSGKEYNFVFDGDKPEKQEIVSKVVAKLDSIKQQTKAKADYCEYCFEPSYTIQKDKNDYIFEIKFKNIGKNDFDLDGFSSIQKVGHYFKSKPMLQIDFGKEFIQLNKENLIDKQFLDVIKLPKSSEATIKFLIKSDEIPDPLKSKDLSKENSSVFLLSRYKSGELMGQYFDMSMK